MLYAVVERYFEVAGRVVKLRQSPEDQERALLRATIYEARQIVELQRATAESRERAADLRAALADAKGAQDLADVVRRMVPALKLAQQAADQVDAERHGRERAEVTAAEARHHGDRAQAMVQGLVGVAEMVKSNVKPPGPIASTLLAGHWLKRAAIHKATAQVISQERTTLRFFLESCSDRPVESYDRGDVTRFLGALRRLPKVYGRSPADANLSMEQLIARADEQAERAAKQDGKRLSDKRLSDKTVKRHLSALSQFFKYAVDKGHMSVSGKSDMVDDHSFKSRKSARQQRGAWASDELKILFSSPVWAGCKSRAQRSEPGELIIRDWRFWLPLLAAYQGGRIEEFADLYRRDIICDDGTWAIVIQPSPDDVEDEEDSADDGQDAERRLKNNNAERTVAIHCEVLQMGFLDYVLHSAPGVDDPLFPDLKPQGADGKRGPRVTRWFVTYRRRFKIYRPGVAMHAFRHTANTRLRNAIEGDREHGYQRERHVNYMLGHALGSGEGGRRYDKGPGLKAAAETLALLRYPELDLSHLYVR